ncbi:MAG: RadC family protein [Planctomycetota bacterium]|jgi:DNA repair protein RadC
MADAPKRLTLRELPPGERPRERLLAHGAGALSDAQLVALILAEGTRGESAVDCAQRLLQESGSLERLAARSPVQLQDVRGVGPAKAARLAAALELARRLAPSGAGLAAGFTGAADVFARMGPRLARRRQESFVVLCCDVKNRVIAEREITRGTLDASLVHPRDVFGTAVREAAAALILVHNHPSGDPEPSAEDVALTRRLADAGELMGIPVLDHVVIGAGRYVSLAERGVL